MTTSRRRRWAALAAIVATSAAACDDDGSSATTQPAATADAATATTSAPGATAAGTVAPGTAARGTAPGSGAAPTTASPTTATPTTEPLGDPVVTLTELARLDQPVDAAWRQGDEAIYVAEQPGRVVRLAPDGTTATVLDVADLTDARGEQGLLGLTFAPAGDVAYVNFTDGDGDTVVAELAVDAAGTFDRASLRPVYTADQPYPNHNGGDVAFGPDGLLYIGLGDGGAAGDPERRAQDLTTPLGKLLRIDPAPSGDRPFTVPADNPFTGEPGALGEIWSYGLRNPWRFAFDAETGDLWIGDVGQNAYEEIDVAPATGGRDAGRGLNFGWSAWEARARFNTDVPGEPHTRPIFDYPHDTGCSISGGERYRGAAIPALAGRYVYADYCSGAVYALAVTGEGAAMAADGTVVLGEVGSPTAIVARDDGELLVLSKDGPVALIAPG